MMDTDLDTQGYAWERALIDAAACAQVVERLAAAVETDGRRRQGGNGRAFAMRQVLARVPELVPMVEATLRQVASVVLGAEAFAVRSMLFDKVPGANWPVAWHQDRTISVQQRLEAAGFGPWSLKEGVHHVEPPVSVLERMVTLRLHLDAATAENGALRVVPGSHRMGRLDGEAVRDAVARGPVVTCVAATGDVLLMRPLLLHASSPSVEPTHRRVLHVEYACDPLPGGLAWAQEETACC